MTRLDIATAAGMTLGIGAIVISFLLDGGHLASVFRWPAITIVVLGTLGAGMITTSLKTILDIPVYLRIAFSRKLLDPLDTIERVAHMAELARKEGILALEREVVKSDSPFFKKAIQLVIDGTEVTELRSILETEIDCIERRHQRGIDLFRKLGGFAPTFGIIGTVLGLIHTLANTSDSSKMAAGIASAFIATLWGICSANLFYLPVGDKLRFSHDQEMSNLELTLEGMVSLQSGENPRLIRSRLLSFIHPQMRAGVY